MANEYSNEDSQFTGTAAGCAVLTFVGDWKIDHIVAKDREYLPCSAAWIWSRWVAGSAWLSVMARN